jgi:hypothetical protein
MRALQRALATRVATRALKYYRVDGGVHMQRAFFLQRALQRALQGFFVEFTFHFKFTLNFYFSGGVLRDCLGEFWTSFYDQFTEGTILKVSNFLTIIGGPTCGLFGVPIELGQKFFRDNNKSLSI